jgi:hypothetical protein
MNRRDFLIRSALLAAGGFVSAASPALAETAAKAAAAAGAAKAAGGQFSFDSDIYSQFRNPDIRYRPFARWWWNGNKVEAHELVRELRLLKEANIGGVEIYPVGLPEDTDDAGIPTLKWLSDEWIDMVKVTLDEADRLGMSCDLMVGTGWPYGGDFVPHEDRAQVVVVDAVKLTGPTVYETSAYSIFKRADPEATTPADSRTFKLLSLSLVPDPLTSLDRVRDLSGQKDNDLIRVDVPAGDHYFYALVKVHDFAGVINGAPGGDGPFIDHMKTDVVQKYLDHMSDTIQKRIGPLAGRIRSFLTDSMELEGSNWTDSMADRFKERYGYDLMPYLPLMLWKTHRLGDVWEYSYGAQKSPELQEAIDRVRYDFETLKAEMLDECYTQTYCKWCNDQGAKSKGQAYGRGFFPLESSMGYSIPEGESWTTNWLKHRLGEEMRDDEYRAGRGYTMINKYVSSAAHLTGKRIVSAEEMTNTYLAFRATLELIKIGSDMSAVSGITHSVWHGFNYSPADAPFPGWVQYGSYYNENNTWWPYFKYLNAYKGRLSSQFQNADMYTDMIILPPNYDMWGEIGVQTDPFPGTLNVLYTSLIWEAICKNGGAADYTSEIVLNASTVKNGKLCYGPKQYGTLFLPEVTSTAPSTLAKIHEFVSQGGRVFCIEKYPSKSLGFKDYKKRDAEVQAWIKKLQAYPDRFILVKKPEDNKFLEWYQELIGQYNLPHYMTVENPDRFFLQTRWNGGDGNTFFFLANVHMHNPYKSKITFSPEITRGRYPWIWNPDTGKRYRITLTDGSFELELGPAETLFIVFDKVSKGEPWKPLPVSAPNALTLKNWQVELHHAREGWVKTTQMETPTDLKETEWKDFAGTVVYRTKFDVNSSNAGDTVLNLGKVYGISQVLVNGVDCGVKWYGNRIYDIADQLHTGSNEIEVRVVTVLGNYMHTLTDNATAQKFTAGRKEWPTLSLGILGPVTLYK